MGKRPHVVIHGNKSPKCNAFEAGPVVELASGRFAELRNGTVDEIFGSISASDCGCAGGLDAETLDGELWDAFEKFAPVDTQRVKAVRRGEPTMNKKQAMALLDKGSTKFNDLINDGTVPQPLRSGVREATWLESEVHNAKARLIAESTARYTRQEDAKRRPTNRHTRRKAAATSK
jgi:predicted DNA-binding transcriptional regulator AlpA